MRAFYFLQIDRTMTKSQGRVMWLFVLIALVSIFNGNPYWGLLYMVFGSTILSTTPFILNQTGSHGFLLMLPATIRDRVAGRFGYGLMMLMTALLLGGISTVVICIIKKTALSSVFFIFYAGLIAGGLIILSLQYALFYIVGEVKSPQLMSILRMVPGFLLFIVGSIATDIIDEKTGIDAAFSWVTWINNHFIECSLLALVIGIVVFFAGFFVSVQAEKKRRFA